MQLIVLHSLYGHFYHHIYMWERLTLYSKQWYFGLVLVWIRFQPLKFLLVQKMIQVYRFNEQFVWHWSEGSRQMISVRAPNVKTGRCSGHGSWDLGLKSEGHTDPTGRNFCDTFGVDFRHMLHLLIVIFDSMFLVFYLWVPKISCFLKFTSLWLSAPLLL